VGTLRAPQTLCSVERPSNELLARSPQSQSLAWPSACLPQKWWPSCGFGQPAKWANQRTGICSPALTCKTSALIRRRFTLCAPLPPSRLPSKRPKVQPRFSALVASSWARLFSSLGKTPPGTKSAGRRRECFARLSPAARQQTDSPGECPQTVRRPAEEPPPNNRCHRPALRGPSSAALGSRPLRCGWQAVIFASRLGARAAHAQPQRWTETRPSLFSVD